MFSLICTFRVSMTLDSFAWLTFTRSSKSPHCFPASFFLFTSQPCKSHHIRGNNRWCDSSFCRRISFAKYCDFGGVKSWCLLLNTCCCKLLTPLCSFLYYRCVGAWSLAWLTGCLNYAPPLLLHSRPTYFQAPVSFASCLHSRPPWSKTPLWSRSSSTCTCIFATPHHPHIKTDFVA